MVTSKQARIRADTTPAGAGGVMSRNCSGAFRGAVQFDLVNLPDQARCAGEVAADFNECRGMCQSSRNRPLIDRHGYWRAIHIRFQASRIGRLAPVEYHCEIYPLILCPTVVGRMRGSGKVVQSDNE